MSRKRYFADKGEGDGIGKKWNTGVRFSAAGGSEKAGKKIEEFRDLGIQELKNQW
jgi:hypothetical protein